MIDLLFDSAGYVVMILAREFEPLRRLEDIRRVRAS